MRCWNRLHLQKNKGFIISKLNWNFLKDFEEKESFRNILQAKGEEIDRQEAEVEALDHRIWNELNPLKIL